MTARARNFAFAIRHMGRALQLRPPHLVTLQAQFRLRLFRADMFSEGLAVPLISGRQPRQFRVPFGNATVVNLVAIDTSHCTGFVRASSPEHLIAFGVAGKAGGVSFLHRSIRIFGEADWDRVFSASCVDMGLSGTMTGFAAKLFLRGLRMHHHGVPHDGVFEALLLVRMARNTNFGADVFRGTGLSVATGGASSCLRCILGPGQAGKSQQQGGCQDRREEKIGRPRQAHSSLQSAFLK
jgi:hypothetical protein